MRVSQYNSAQMIADKWNFSREAMESFALESHRRALSAMEKGFSREIQPLEDLDNDETPRNTSMEKMAELDPLAEGGLLQPQYLVKLVMVPQEF